MNKIRTLFTAAVGGIRGALAVFHRWVPKIFYFFPALALIAAILHLICNFSTPFADLMIEKICAPMRFVLAKATGWVPFSVGELTLLLLPLIVAILIGITVKILKSFHVPAEAEGEAVAVAAAEGEQIAAAEASEEATVTAESDADNIENTDNPPKKGKKGKALKKGAGKEVFDAKLYCRTLAFLLSVLFLLYSLFVLTLAPGYKSTTLDRKLGLERVPVSAQELLSTAEILRDKAHAELDSVAFRFADFSVMPYSYDEMNEKLNDAFAQVAEQHDFLTSFRSNIKYVMLSEPMSYTHITGVYSYYTGEANLNINFPDYSLLYTAAHELAHQRGIARENEANFIAFLVCIQSEDPYIRYSGYVNLLEYVMNSLYSASPALYTEFYGTLDRRIVYEFYASSRFFDQYRENIAADVSDAVNNNYLQSQGQTAGTRSYGLVVDLAVAYYKTNPVE